MNNRGTQIIETERLILRKFDISDTQQMFDNWASNNRVTKYLTWTPHKNIDETREILSSWISHYNDDRYYQWCIELKETSQAIGSIGTVEVLQETETVRIAYCIGRTYWNKGIMTEALSAVIKFFFEEADINRIQAEHDTNNPASGKVMTKCGMKYEGTHIQAARNQQGLCDIAVYGITKRDYRAI